MDDFVDSFRFSTDQIKAIHRALITTKDVDEFSTQISLTLGWSLAKVVWIYRWSVVDEFSRRRRVIA